MRRLLCWLVCCLLLSAFLSPARAELLDYEGNMRRNPYRMPGPAEIDIADRVTIRNKGSITRSPYLDAAFSMLEEGNPFLERYNLLTGAGISPLFPYGVPYFIGGTKYRTLAVHIPEYTVYAAWQNTLYYRSGVNYLYGFDCMGFARWVWEQAGRDPLTTISDMLMRSESDALYCSGGKKPMPDWEKLPEVLEPGALLALTHPGNHIAVYIGTLRQYGYTPVQVPLLKDYLDYPLVIHCTVNASVANRFAWLLRNGSPRYHGVTVTDGGVCVSILGLMKTQAQHSVSQQLQMTYWFDLPDQTWLTLLDVGEISQYAWYP